MDCGREPKIVTWCGRNYDYESVIDVNKVIQLRMKRSVLGLTESQARSVSGGWTESPSVVRLKNVSKTKRRGGSQAHARIARVLLTATQYTLLSDLPTIVVGGIFQT